MMKKILYINYMRQMGHVNFDLIHINALLRKGYDVKVVAHACMTERMSLPGAVVQILPKWLDVDSQNGILNRIMYLFTLLYIRLRVRVGEYDHVIVSNLEEISLCMIPLCQDKLIFSHGPNDSFQSKFKTFFMRRIGRKNTFVVFNKHMMKPFLDAGINNVDVISHGCMPAYSYHDKTSIAEYVSDAKRVVFHPSNCPNQRFLQQLLTDTEIQQILEEQDAVILMRDKSGRNNSKGRVKIISEYLSDEMYQNLLLRSDIVLLAYPDDFLYRVSGVSYECLANRKKMLILDNPSFYYCRDFYTYDPMFCDISELSAKIRTLLSQADDTNAMKVESVSPDYSSLLN